MLKFKEEEFYLITNKGKHIQVMCVGVGSKFSFFSPIELTKDNIEVDMTRIWSLSNAEPQQTVINKIVLPRKRKKSIKHGKEN